MHITIEACTSPCMRWVAEQKQGLLVINGPTAASQHHLVHVNVDPAGDMQGSPVSSPVTAACMSLATQEGTCKSWV